MMDETRPYPEGIAWDEALRRRRMAERLADAIDNIRDAVLHGRHQLAEMEIDTDVTNAILDIIDDYDPRGKDNNEFVS